MTEKKKSNTIEVVFALLVVMAAAGLVFLFVPNGNPVNSVGGTTGTGLYYASIICICLATVCLIFYVLRNIIRDLLISFGDEVGIDMEEVLEDCSDIFISGACSLVGKKREKNENEIPLDKK